MALARRTGAGAGAGSPSWRRISACRSIADARVGDLSVGERQRVEILKALYRDARILILDEPTAVLTPQESAALFATLKKLVAAGPVDHLHLPQAERGDGGQRPHPRAARRQAGRRAPHIETPIAGAGRADGRPARCRAPKVEPQAAGAVAGAAQRCARRGATAQACSMASTWRCAAARSSASPASPATARARSPICLAGLSAPAAGTVALFGAADPTGGRAPSSSAGVGRIPEDRHAVGLSPTCR